MRRNVAVAADDLYVLIIAAQGFSRHLSQDGMPPLSHVHNSGMQVDPAIPLEHHPRRRLLPRPPSIYAHGHTDASLQMRHVRIFDGLPPTDGIGPPLKTLPQSIAGERNAALHGLRVHYLVPRGSPAARLPL